MKQIHRIHITIFLLSLSLILLVGCNSQKSPNQNDFHLENDLLTTIPDLGDTEINDVCVFGDNAYLIADENCYVYNFSDTTVSQFACGGSAICVDPNHVYICSTDNSTLSVYSPSDFSLIATHTLDIPQESILQINKILPVEHSLILDVLYLNTAGYSESHVYEYNVDKKLLTDHTESFKSKDSYSLLMSMDVKNSDTLVFVSVANTSFTNTIIKSYTYNFKKQTVEDEFIFDFYLSNCAYDSQSDCYYYSDNNYTLKQYVPSDDGVSTIANLKKEDIGENQYIDNFFLVNNYIVIFKNSSDVLAVTNTTLPDDSLRILAYNNIQEVFDLNEIIEQYERAYSKNVYVTLYESSVYKDILRTKLLSKEDDFDIIFIDNPTESNFLSSIINYELYAPLNENEKVNENFQEMYPGVSDMVRFHDAVIGVPYNVSISNLLMRTSASDIHSEFELSLADVWSICETLADDDEYTMFTDPYMMNRFLADTIQSQILTDNLNIEDIEALLTNIKKNYDNGTLFLCDMDGNILHEDRSASFAYAQMFFTPFILRSGEMVFPENGVVSYPYAAKKYVELNGLAMINKYTSNLDSAYEFISVMTDRDNLYSTGTKGVYKFTLLGKQLEENVMYSSWTTDEVAYLSVLPQLYSNASIYTFDYKSFMDHMIDNIISAFYAGTLSPEDAAKEIITYVEYTYFE